LTKISRPAVTVNTKLPHSRVRFYAREFQTTCSKLKTSRFTDFSTLRISPGNGDPWASMENKMNRNLDDSQQKFTALITDLYSCFSFVSTRMQCIGSRRMVESVAIIRDTKQQLQITNDCANIHLHKIPVSISRFLLIK
jgi:hypothetical protein